MILFLSQPLATKQVIQLSFVLATTIAPVWTLRTLLLAQQDASSTRPDAATAALQRFQSYTTRPQHSERCNCCF